MSFDMIIYVATHSKVFNNTEDYKIPIQVGAAENSIRFADIRDDTGDNISSKNKNYCELTALYWMWKNSPCDILGLEHYRRHFRIKKEDITYLLTIYDMIVPKPYYFSKSLSEEYSDFHSGEDWNLLLKILLKKYPQKESEISKVFNSNKLYPFNMIIASGQQLSNYCTWLFPILFELETYIDFIHKDDYQSRVLGFIAERLFTLYINLNQIKVYECQVSIPEKRNILLKLKYNLGIYFNRIYYTSKRIKLKGGYNG